MLCPHTHPPPWPIGSAHAQVSTTRYPFQSRCAGQRGCVNRSPQTELDASASWRCRARRVRAISATRSSTPARSPQRSLMSYFARFVFAHRFVTKSRIRFERDSAGTSAHTARPPAPDECLPPFAPILAR